MQEVASLKNKSRSASLSHTAMRQKGVTLIELIITIVIIGIAMSALVSALTTGISRSAQPMLEGKALELSQAYLDEIQAMRFDDQSPIGGGAVLAASNPCTMSNEGQARTVFDDVDDYNGVNDSPPVLIESGIDMSAYANYRVMVSVACAGSELSLSSNALAKRINVTVVLPSGESRDVAIYKGNF